MNDQEREAKLIEMTLSLQAQIGGLELIVQELIAQIQGDSFDQEAYHQRLRACREIYRTHFSYHLEDIDPKAASEFFPAPPGLIPPEEQPSPE